MISPDVLMGMTYPQHLKIAVVGAASFVFGPSVLAQVFAELRMHDVEVALMDVDAEALDRMAGIGRRLIRDHGIEASSVTATSDRSTALDGAHFVICCAAPQMQRRFAQDRAIIEQLAPGHGITEFGGLSGIAYSLRQIAFIQGLTDDMRRLCPDALLLNVSNPLPRVAQSAEENGIKTVGFCSVAISAYSMIWRILEGEYLHYPFIRARERWRITTAGVNHLAFVVRFEDTITGEDLYPMLRRRLSEGATSGNPRSERLCRETGYLLVPGDDHTHDFFAPRPGEMPRGGHDPWHGGPEERKRRLDLLQAVGDGSLPIETLLEHEAWEKPASLIGALARGGTAHFTSLNLRNTGRQIAELPSTTFVETPCHADADGLKAETIHLPEAVLPYCRDAADITDIIVRAARSRSRALIYGAVDRDPTIVDKVAGTQAMDAILAANADIVGDYVAVT